jgi:hypothetical protein
MGYSWSTILLIMGYVVGVHSFRPEIEELIEETAEIKLLL